MMVSLAAAISTAMAASWSVEEATTVWPRPRKASSGASSVTLVPGRVFEHGTGCCKELLAAAFSRAEAHIFRGAPSLPHVRTRVVGVRADGAPAERALCGDGEWSLSSKSGHFGGLRVEVGAATATPLQHGMERHRHASTLRLKSSACV